MEFDPMDPIVPMPVLKPKTLCLNGKKYLVKAYKDGKFHPESLESVLIQEFFDVSAFINPHKINVFRCRISNLKHFRIIVDENHKSSLQKKEVTVWKESTWKEFHTAYWEWKNMERQKKRDNNPANLTWDD